LSGSFSGAGIYLQVLDIVHRDHEQFTIDLDYQLIRADSVSNGTECTMLQAATILAKPWGLIRPLTASR
jgi:hypothetical protein